MRGVKHFEPIWNRVATTKKEKELRKKAKVKRLLILEKYLCNLFINTK